MSKILFCCAVLWLVSTSAFAQEDEILAGGKIKFGHYCASCHGAAAEGDGPLSARLTVKPANLTQLSKRNNGQFPFWRVYRVVDGREEVLGHGSREMPMWGLIFHVEEGAKPTANEADLVRGRIWQLIYYLESIQEK
jgi:mono/diheme cytochrome c family protein